MRKLLVVTGALTVLSAACGDETNDPPSTPPITTVDAGDLGFDAAVDMARDMRADLMPMDAPRVSVDPPLNLLKVATGVQLGATYFNVDGTVDETMMFTWSSEDESVATVDDTGMVLGTQHGRTAIVATSADEDETSNRAIVGVYAPSLGVAVGRVHSCGFNSQGWTWCTGDNAYNQLGKVDPLPETTAIRVDFAEDSVLDSLVSGRDHTCGIDTTGDVFCWGRNNAGQLGNSTTNNSPVPLRNTLPAPAIQVAAGGNITCALTEANALFCWGDNSSNAISGDAVESVLEPLGVHQARTFQSVAVGSGHICAIDTDFNILCWGDNTAAQLGPNTTAPSTHTTQIIPGSGYATVWAGNDVTCAETFFAALNCWGTTPATFDGVETASETPIEIEFPAGTDIHAVGFMDESICASLDSGTFCWGDNTYGQLADTTTESHFTPEAITGSTPFTQLKCGLGHCCALTNLGDTFCWGANGQGQLGDGTSTNARRPIFFQPAIR